MNRYLLQDRIAGKWLAEVDGKFVWANCPHGATVYEDEMDAEWAAYNAGGDIRIVIVHPIPGITEGY